MKNKKVPIVYQIEVAECGAASLGMILAYYGRYVDLTTLRKDCRISRDGSRLDYIIEAAKKYGLDSTPLRTGPIFDIVKLPAIVFWDFYHFLVVEEYSEKRVVICDPAMGRKIISLEEFNKHYTGIALELTPNENFVKGGKPFSSLKYIINLILERKDAITFLIILLIILNAISIIIPRYANVYIDEFLSYAGSLDLTRFFIMYFIVVFSQIPLLILKKQVILRFQKIESAYIVGNTVKKILRLPYSYFTTRDHATLITRIEACDSLSDFITKSAVPALLGVLFSLIYIYNLFTYSLLIGIAVIISSVILVLIFYKLINLSKSSAVQGISELTNFYASINQTIRLYDTIKSSALEKDSMTDIVNKYNNYANVNQNTKLISTVATTFPIVVPLILQVLVISIGCYQLLLNKLTIGEMLACQSWAMALFAPFADFISQFIMIQSQDINVRSINDIMSETNDPLIKLPGIEDVEKIKGDLEISNVNFAYNTSLPPTIENISFKVEAGHSIAIVGASGSGKSTILKTIEGTVIPQDGKVLLGGESIYDIVRGTIANSMAVVSQTPSLFYGTVRDNIALFDKSISMEQVILASKEACIYEDIMVHFDGYNSIINPKALDFSGGQVQRIMIARALIKNPTILILEEATSALDSVIEEEIMNNIKSKGITRIVVAHRLSTIRDCDEIIVLDKGKIVEQGTHENLLNSNVGKYRELVLSEEYNK